MVTLKADDRKRVQIPDAKPGQVFAYENRGNGSFVLTEVVPRDDSKVVNPIKGKDGLYRWPVKLSRKEIIAAIRADRDSR